MIAWVRLVGIPCVRSGNESNRHFPDARSTLMNKRPQWRAHPVFGSWVATQRLSQCAPDHRNRSVARGGCGRQAATTVAASSAAAVMAGVVQTLLLLLLGGGGGGSGSSVDAPKTPADGTPNLCAHPQGFGMDQLCPVWCFTRQKVVRKLV